MTDVEVKNKLQTFIDNHIIDSVTCLKREVHQPEKCQANPLVAKDKPWEINLYLTCNTWNVLWDPEEEKFKCWYEDWGLDFEARRKLIKEVPFWLSPRVSQYRTLYAESQDGLRWEKPKLNAVNGHPDTNIVAGDPVYGNVHAPCVFLDPKEDDAQRRFKMIYTNYGHEEKTSHGIITIAHSPDGIHWTPYEEHPVFGDSGPRLGDVWTMYCDKEKNQYILPTRHIKMHSHGKLGRIKGTPRLPGFFDAYYPEDPERMNKRRVSLCKSDDLFHWNEPYEVVVPNDDIDNLDDCFYGMQITRLGDIYLGFVHKVAKVDNTMEVYLTYSRDLEQWKHVIPRKPFLPTGPAGSWDQYMVDMPNHPINTETETLVYYGAFSCHHDWWIQGMSGMENLDVPEAWNASLIRSGLGLARLGRDRYVSLQAGPRPGLVATKPFSLEGNRLIINASCRKNGFVKVEVADGNQEVLEGLSKDDCDVFTGDSASHEVTWNGYPSIDVQGVVRLHIYMKDADLYSFRIDRH